MTEESNKLLKNLGYLYLAFAHITDRNLSDEEMEMIRERLKAKDPSVTNEEITDILHDVTHWYNRTANNRAEVVQSIAGMIHYDFSNIEDKKKIIEDLREIANADHVFKDTESQMIEVFSKAWGIDS